MTEPDAPDPITRRSAGIRWRNPAVVYAALSRLDLGDLPRTELVSWTRDRYPALAPATIGKTLDDLADLGAVRYIGAAGRPGLARLTGLGRAWLAGHTTDPTIPTLDLTLDDDEIVARWARKETR